MTPGGTPLVLGASHQALTAQSPRLWRTDSTGRSRDIRGADGREELTRNNNTVKEGMRGLEEKENGYLEKDSEMKFKIWKQGFFFI